MIVLNSKLPQWPIKQYIPAAPHVWLIWSSGTLHAELYGLPLPTFSLLLVVTSHLVLNVFARYLLLSGIVSRLTSILVKLSQHSADTLNLIFSIQPLSLPSEWPISAPLIRSRLWSIINLFTYLLTYLPVSLQWCLLLWMGKQLQFSSSNSQNRWTMALGSHHVAAPCNMAQGENCCVWQHLFLILPDVTQIDHHVPSPNSDS